MITIDGKLPPRIGIGRRELRRAAEYFAARSAARCGRDFAAVTVILQDDDFSAETHLAINGVEGATDVITQPYDAMPGECPGIYGELYVNAEQALHAAPRRHGWSAAKELLLYVAHGMDHLSGADDFAPSDYARMRRRELGWLRDFLLSSTTVDNTLLMRKHNTLIDFVGEASCLPHGAARCRTYKLQRTNVLPG